MLTHTHVDFYPGIWIWTPSSFFGGIGLGMEALSNYKCFLTAFLEAYFSILTYFIVFKIFAVTE
jgi:hypothetical protein